MDVDGRRQAAPLRSGVDEVEVVAAVVAAATWQQDPTAPSTTAAKVRAAGQRAQMNTMMLPLQEPMMFDSPCGILGSATPSGARDVSLQGSK